MKKVACAFLVICLLVISCVASFSADTGALVRDSEYFMDKGFDSASALLEGAKTCIAQSFTLVYYSRYDNVCRWLVPRIKEWADTNNYTVYGIDQYNKYTQEYGYFNKNTVLSGWDSFLSRRDFSFPAVFTYNADTRTVYAQSGLSSVMDFTGLLQKSGMLASEYHDFATAGVFAQKLSELDLIPKGKSFELTRAPTRAEACALAVTLAGKRSQAEMFSYPNPFSDVSGENKPYIAYAYANGWIEPSSSRRFKPNEAITAEDFFKMMLAFAGYDEFSLENAVKIGALPQGVNTHGFLRADMMIAARAMLDTYINNSSQQVIDRLISSKTVSATQVKRVLSYDKREETDKTSDVWKSAIEITAESPEYTVEAISAALKRKPEKITVSVPDGRETDYVSYIKKAFGESEIINSISVKRAEKSVVLEPSYTIAAGARCYALMKGYEASALERQTAERAKALLAENPGIADEEYVFSWLSKLQTETDDKYGDADSAILEGRATSDGKNRALWLLYELLGKTE